MLVRMICPFLYSLLLGCVWGGWFKKKFSSSLAVAFMTHILVVLVSGLTLKRLSIGIYGGIVIAIVSGIMLVIKNKGNISKQTIVEFLHKNWNEGMFIYTLFYIFCFVTNYGKRFTSWDEFSHWGMFLKESLRLDSLYCMSPLTFAHKDYVPALTLFETIWCKLCGRFAENDAYRSIQIIMFAMLLPMFESVSEFVNEKNSKGGNAVSRLKNRFFQLGAVLIVLLVPLAFNTSNAFFFYHSLYCDMAVGIVFFWCIFESYRDYEDIIYQFCALTIGVTVLVLSKMTAMALLPLVVSLFIVKMIVFSNGRQIHKYHYLLTVPLVMLPVGLWLWFNSFVDKYVDNTGGIQSYDGMKLSSLIEVFISPENSAIPYLKTVKDAYIDAIIHRDILIHGSYVVALVSIVIAFFVIANFCDRKILKGKAALSGIWAMLSGVFYALLMYFLYCTQFGGYEATRLVSYERYMNSFIVAVLFFLLAVYFDSEIWRVHVKGYYLIIALLLFDLSFLHVSAFDQVLPGTITRDEELVSGFTIYASAIMGATGENDSIYIVKRGDNGDFIWHQRFYCSPRTIGGGSIGPMAYEGDIWSRDISVEEFVTEVASYDYIFFCGLDEAFLEKYSDAFYDATQLVNGEIYRIEVKPEPPVKIYLHAAK